MLVCSKIGEMAWINYDGLNNDVIKAFSFMCFAMLEFRMHQTHFSPLALALNHATQLLYPVPTFTLCSKPATDISTISFFLQMVPIETSTPRH